jgi:hypothetical protein
MLRELIVRALFVVQSKEAVLHLTERHLNSQLTDSHKKAQKAQNNSESQAQFICAFCAFLWLTTPAFPSAL